MKFLSIAIPALMSFATASASIPENYYSTLDSKQGEALKAALGALSASHKVITYNTKTWGAFEKTDVRMLNGREIWWDMYSNNIVYLPDHSGMNIEHSVPNSWWGGKNGSVEAYSDLFHLNPSDQNANNKKGNYPPGEVADARLLDNGLLKIGTPVSGQGGGASSVFEPADEFKGDFARAYFYVFTAYAGLSWTDNDSYVCAADGSLAPWATEVLLKWHREDPVDSKELDRNEAVYGEQGNRNPFIDYPALAEYIWGVKKAESFSLSEATPAVAVDRPAAPGFDDVRTVGVNTFSARWWDGVAVRISHDEGTLMASVDGEPFAETDCIVIDPAENGNERHVIKAYTVKENEGYTLTSPMATLTMIARDPAELDYTEARWVKVTDAADILQNEGPYLLLSSNTLQAMSATGGTSSQAFMESAGYVDFTEEVITEIPVEAAVVDFEELGGSKTRLMVKDIHGNFKGSWNATAKNKMKLDAQTYTPGTISMGTDNTFVYTFDQYGSLQYNASQPRFLNYESNQKPVYIYKFKEFENPGSGINAPAVANPWGIGVDSDGITVSEGTVIFDLAGRRVIGRGLRKGVYIVVRGTESRKVILP